MIQNNDVRRLAACVISLTYVTRALTEGARWRRGDEEEAVKRLAEIEAVATSVFNRLKEGP